MTFRRDPVVPARLTMKTLSHAPWRKWLLLQTAAGIGLVVGGARYYFTHPQRVVATLPPDLAPGSREVFLPGSDGVRLHGVWMGGHGTRTIIHHPGYSSCGGIVLARPAGFRLVRPVGVVSPWRPERGGAGGQQRGDRRGRELVQGRQAQNGEPLTAWPLVRAALARGYNFLLVDARAHGKSDGPWDPKGMRAAGDLAGWVRWLREEQGQVRVGLWGNSFGSVLGLTLAACPVEAVPNAGCGALDAMVLDSPAISGTGLYAGVIRAPLYWVVQPVIWHLANGQLLEWLRQADVTVPILLIHGMADTHVPAWHSQEAYKLLWSADAPERTELWLVPGADHLEALEVAGEAYIQRTLGWFDRWLI